MKDIEDLGSELPVSKSTIKVKQYVDSMKFEKFNPLNDINRKGFASIIIAKRGLGKSTFLNDLVYHLSKKNWYDSVHVFSLTADLQPDLFSYVPSKNIHYGLDSEKMEDMWAKKKSFMLKEMAAGKEKDSLPFDLIICDDLAGNKKECRNTEILNRLYMAGRHLNFAIIFLTQYFCAVPYEIRSNTDFVVCFTLRTKADQEHFVEEFLSCESNAIGFEILRKNTFDVGFQCMVVLSNKNVTDAQEYVRVYTASIEIPKFKIIDKRGYNKEPIQDPKRGSEREPKQEPSLELNFINPRRRRH